MCTSCAAFWAAPVIVLWSALQVLGTIVRADMVKLATTLIFLCCVLLAAPLAAPRAAAVSEPGAKSQVADKAKKGVPCADKAKTRADQNRTVTVKKRDDAVHARAWTFREGSSLDAWQSQGTPTDNLHSRAVNAPAAGKSVDTAKGIDSALNAASGHQKNKSALALSVDDESSSWREPGPAASIRTKI